MKRNYLISLLALLLFVFASEGPNSGSTFISDGSNGMTDEWLTPTRAVSSNDSWATCSQTGGETQYLNAQGFGFTSVTGTVDGILVEIEERAVTGGAYEQTIKVVKGGTIQGTNKSTGANLPVTDTYVSYGGAADLWGLSWTAADITAADFGCVISTNSAGVASTRIDHIRITVTYTAAASGTKRRVFGEIRDANGNGGVTLINEYDYRVSAKGGWKFARF
ncbi:MAG: hypothetical protein EPO24_09380 [Bacteroidetes bacterium]|nr:MAG: hypothetical protein EPO24_09380 [Bacteroidota bacterium]